MGDCAFGGRRARAGGPGKADGDVQCVLAQLSTSGQLVGVSAAALQAWD